MLTALRPKKTKVTVSLSPELVRELDALAHGLQARQRSQLVEQALRWWLTARVQAEIERQTEEYYRSLSLAESEEDKQWNRLAVQAARQLWHE